MGLTQKLLENHSIKDVKQIDYFDIRYYKILYEQNKQLIEEYFPSVTEILGAYPHDWLARWRGDVGNERADQIMFDAQNKGSFIHYGAELLAKGGIVIYQSLQKPTFSDKEIDDLAKKYPAGVCICRRQAEYIQIYRIAQYFNVVKPIKIETEQTVYSVKHKYAGTLDLLHWINEGEYEIAGTQPLYLESGYYVGDYKTGKEIGSTYKMQIAAYMEAVMEGIPDMRTQLRGGLILHPNNERVKNGIQGFKATLVDRADGEMYFDHFMKTYAVYQIDKPVPKPTEYKMPAILVYEQPTAKAVTKRKAKG